MSTELQKTLETCAKSEEGVENSEDDETEESSTDEEMRARRRVERREEKRRAKEQAWIAGMRREAEHRRILLAQRTLADDEVCMDVDAEMARPARLADLDTPAGRSVLMSLLQSRDI